MQFFPFFFYLNLFLEFIFVYFIYTASSMKISYLYFFFFFGQKMDKDSFINRERDERNTSQRSRVDTLCSSVPAGQRPRLHPPRVRNFNGHSVLTYIWRISLRLPSRKSRSMEGEKKKNDKAGVCKNKKDIKVLKTI